MLQTYMKDAGKNGSENVCRFTDVFGTIFTSIPHVCLHHSDLWAAPAPHVFAWTVAWPVRASREGPGVSTKHCSKQMQSPAYGGPRCVHLAVSCARHDFC